MRRLFTFLSALSLLLCVAVCVLWVASYEQERQIVLADAPDADVSVVANGGELGLTLGVIVPLWAVATMAAAIPACWVGWYISRRFRGRPNNVRGLCPSCGYDLRATPDRCPECGRACVTGKVKGPENAFDAASSPR